MKLLEEMEGERLAEWSFSEIKEKLINHEIPWSKLPSCDEKTPPFSLPSMTIEIPGCKPKKIERSFVLKCHKNGEKIGPQNEIYRMLYVEIRFNPKLSGETHKKKKPKKGKGHYSYRMIVQKN